MISKDYLSLSCTDIAPLKNIINEMYARDTSRKIRSAFQTKIAEGAFIGNFAPFGYQKNPENKNHLLPDPVVAPIVQEVFYMAEQGAPPAEIIHALNLRCIATPAAYRRTKQLCRPADAPKWTSSTVCKLLRNAVYLGHISQGKTTKVSFKSHLTLQNSPADWVIVPHMHEPLISQDTFDAVRRRSVSRRGTTQTGFTNIFSGIAKCSDCGCNLSTGSHSRSGYTLVCGGYKLHGKVKCSHHSIRYDTLYQAVLHELQSLLTLSAAAQRELIEAIPRADAPSPNRFEHQKKRREVELDRVIARLYEDRVNGQLEEARFSKLLAHFEAEQRELSACARLRPAPPPEVVDTDALHAILSLRELTPALLRKLISKIEISQSTSEEGRKCQHIKIYYRFADPDPSH